ARREPGNEDDAETRGEREQNPSLAHACLPWSKEPVTRATLDRPPRKRKTSFGIDSRPRGAKTRVLKSQKGEAFERGGWTHEGSSSLGDGRRGARGRGRRAVRGCYGQSDEARWRLEPLEERPVLERRRRRLPPRRLPRLVRRPGRGRDQDDRPGPP